MDCQGFRSRHLDYTEGTLDDATLVACERHRAECAACAAHDTRVRRSLMVCHSVPLTEHRCDLTARVLAGIRADRARTERRRRVASWVGGCAACALAVASFFPRDTAPAADARLVGLSAAVRPVLGEATPAPTPPSPVSSPASVVPVVGPMEPAQWVDDSTDRQEHVPPPLLRPRFAPSASSSGFVAVSLLAP